MEVRRSLFSLTLTSFTRFHNQEKFAMSRRTNKSRWTRMNQSATRGCAAVRRYRLRFEPLEDRRMLATLVVDPTSTLASHFNTISAAVAAAHNGDTINVAAGIYNESVDVNKSLTIVGGKPNFNFFITDHHFATTISPGSDNAGFLLDASNITIKNFFIKGASVGINSNSTTPFSGFNLSNNEFLDNGVGIELDTSLTKANKDSTIGGNIFTNDGTAQDSIYGIEIPIGARNVTISNNSFNAQGTNAIVIEGSSVSSNVQILNNLVHNFAINQTAGIEAGISVYNLAGGKINGNTIDDPTTTAIELAGGVTNTQVENNSLTDGGLGVQNVSAIVLNEDGIATADSGNTISGNSIQGFFDGIDLSNATGNKVLNNDLSAQTNLGIALSNSSSNTFTSNTVTDSATMGISVVQGSGNTFSTNVVRDCASDGIDITSTSGNTFSGNVAKFNADNGFFESQSTSNKFSGNTANQNFDGFLISANLDTFSGNIASANLHSGFVVSDVSSGNNFTKNVANNNVGIGFEVGGGNTITGNQANGNRLGGFDISHGGGTIKSNTANGNLNFGIEFDEVLGATISGNTANNNAISGITMIDGSNNNTVSGNTVKNNGNSGILVDSTCSGNTLSKNTATNNGLFGGFDLEDDSTGAGTDGTANTWSNNTFDISHPVALD
jgi:parallel beta-helix repeat protein